MVTELEVKRCYNLARKLGASEREGAGASQDRADGHALCAVLAEFERLREAQVGRDAMARQPQVIKPIPPDTDNTLLRQFIELHSPSERVYWGGTVIPFKVGDKVRFKDSPGTWGIVSGIGLDVKRGSSPHPRRWKLENVERAYDDGQPAAAPAKQKCWCGTVTIEDGNVVMRPDSLQYAERVEGGVRCRRCESVLAADV